MRLNEHNLPDRVCSVIDGLNPPRKPPTRDVIHVTDLLMPAYARNLLIDKADEVEVDYSDWLISVQGDALHQAYQKYLELKGYVCELHLSEEIEGVKLVGTLDSYKEEIKTLIDLKQTSVWGPSYKIDDYTIQTNCYAWLLNKVKGKVEKIYIDVWYRNWKLADQLRNRNYPKIPYERIEIEVWPTSKTEQFIKDQIHYLLMCKDECSREDKWQKFSAMRSVNGKEKITPDKNFSSRSEAEYWIKNWTPEASCLKKAPKGKVSFRLVDTEPTSCLHYCSARSVCPYAKSLKSGRIFTDRRDNGI